MTIYHKNNSTTAKRCEHNAYGQATIYDADYSTPARTTSAIGNDYLFTGRRYDAEIGNHYYRNRYYNQDLARFLQKDPLGIAPNAFMGNQNFAPKSQYTDGSNLYQYVSSNSVNKVDYWGLEEACCKVKEKYEVNKHYGGSYGGYFVRSSGTKCYQTTINSGGRSAHQACKCKFKNNPKITIYGAKKGECCSCTVSLLRVSFYDILPNVIYPLNHSLVHISCPKSNRSYYSQVNPKSSNQIEYITHDGTLDDFINNSTRKGIDVKKQVTVSCDNAKLIESNLIAGISWKVDNPTNGEDFGSCHRYSNFLFGFSAGVCP